MAGGQIFFGYMCNHIAGSSVVVNGMFEMREERK